MSIHPLFILTIKSSIAHLILTPCPGTKGVELGISLEQIKDAGAHAVLTFMTKEELEKNQLSDLGKTVKAKGMCWFHLPINDDEAPESPFLSAWETSGPAIHRMIEQGKSIAVHCKGGTGRTSLVSAQILLERGEEIGPLMERIKQLRPKAFMHACHRDYLQSLATNL